MNGEAVVAAYQSEHAPAPHSHGMKAALPPGFGLVAIQKAYFGNWVHM